MSTARSRYDPTDYARRQQEKREKAQYIRSQRQQGAVSEEHTFIPKVNPRNRPVPDAGGDGYDDPTRRRFNKPTNPRDGMHAPGGNRPPLHQQSHYGNNNQGGDSFDDSDSLDQLSGRYPKRQPRQNPEQELSAPAELQSDHDSLFREVKRATGMEIHDETPVGPKGNSSNGGAQKAHSGPCLRNSSCQCPKCSGVAMNDANSTMTPSPAVRPPRRRDVEQNRSRRYPSPQQVDPYASSNAGEMENSLSLLKAKMARRKARSAPTNDGLLMTEPAVRQPVVQSAREPVARDRQAATTNGRMKKPAPEPPQSKRTPASRVRKEAPIEPPLEQQSEEDRETIPQPPPLTRGAIHVDEYAEEEEEKGQCANCNRTFNLSVLEKHGRVCKKVFSGTRKVFNMTAKRLEGTEAEQIAKKSKASSNKPKGFGADSQIIKPKGASWKQKSDMFRNAMKANKDVSQAIKEGKELPPPIPSAPDPSLIQCEYCTRRFNEKAAERHIPFCREKSQRDNVARGPPRKGPVRATGRKR